MDSSVIESFRAFGLSLLLLPAVFFVGYGETLAKPPGARFASLVAYSALGVAIIAYLTKTLPALALLALLMPAVQLGTFRSLRRLFIRYFDRPPQTAAFNFASGILPDRIFSVVLLVTTVVLPILLVAYLVRTWR